MSKKVNDSRLRFDEFVKILRPDPRETDTKYVVIKGYLGQSSEEDHVRVYLDDATSFFIDVAEADICHAVPLTPEESSSGGSKLWFNINTVFLYGDPTKGERSRDSFRSGRLMRDYFKLAQAAQFNPIGGSGFFAAPDESGFHPDCVDPPTIWDITPCQACDPSCILSPTFTCAPLQPQFGANTEGGRDGHSGFGPFNPYGPRR